MDKRPLFTGIIGNILEHYDNALFGLLAPFIAPLFFHTLDPFTALLMTYAILPLGMISRPFGALCFGLISDRFGRRQALCWSLSGVAFATIAIGFLPTCKPFSPVLLAFLRLVQSFFAAGESTGGAIYVLENTHLPKRSLVSSLFDASSIAGILIASALVTLLSIFNCMETGWKYLFWAGGATGIVGIFLRMQDSEIESKPNRVSLMRDILDYRKPFLAIILAAGFSYTTYSLAFTFMNGYIPLITSISKIEVMKLNTALLGLDLFLLPFFGYLSQRYGKERIMLFGALCSCLGAIPLFSLLGSSSTLAEVTLIRLFLIVSGIAFAAPYHAWAIEQVPVRCRSTILCLGYTLGSQVLGTPTSAICLWSYKQTGLAVAPAFYLLVLSIFALFALRIRRPFSLVVD